MNFYLEFLVNLHKLWKCPVGIHIPYYLEQQQPFRQ